MNYLTSDVYFFTARTQSHKQSMSKVKGPLALKYIGLDSLPNDSKVVVKTHFGATENVRYLRPSYIRFLCDYIKEIGGTPTVAESCGWGIPESISGVHTEYSGRATEEEYLNVARIHGFTHETMGAPIIMLDGKDGTDIENQKIDGNVFKEVRVAGRLREFDRLVIASHFKGHPSAGFGGAIKNLGIGCVSKGGKVEAHTGKKFEFNLDAPISDYERCIEICPKDALKKGNNGKLVFDEEKCSYCYMCSSVCENNRIDLGEASREEFITHMVDNAKGVVDFFGKDKIFYINYAIDITYQCDCSGGSDTPFIPDIGVLASRDPVALDQACIDLAHNSMMSPYSSIGDIQKLKETIQVHDWFSFTPRFDPATNQMDYNLKGNKSTHWENQLALAEQIGLGTKNYNLIEVMIDKEGNTSI